MIVSVVLALAIGGGVGYSLGNGMNNDATKTKQLQDSITMMKEQSAKIQKMAEMMKSGGATLEAAGMKYMDDAAVTAGKDLVAIGEKYLAEDKAEVKKDESMGNIMK